MRDASKPWSVRRYRRVHYPVNWTTCILTFATQEEAIAEFLKPLKGSAFEVDYIVWCEGQQTYRYVTGRKLTRKGPVRMAEYAKIVGPWKRTAMEEAVYQKVKEQLANPTYPEMAK